MERYYLVSPEKEKKKDKGYFYWMRENDDNWVQFVKGIWCPKTNKDEIKLCAEIDIEETFLLDWSNTWLHRPDSNAGWLNRDGRFFGCPWHYHDHLAKFVLGYEVPEVEDAGWVRVQNSQYYTCEKRLSAEQENWLSTRGFKIFGTNY